MPLFVWLTKKVKYYVDKYFEAAQKINSRKIYQTAYFGKYEYFKLSGKYKMLNKKSMGSLKKKDMT